MKRKLKSTKIPRRLFSVTMSCVFIISLSSCSSSKNNYGKLDQNSVYATSGKYSVTNGELWNELKWNASTVLTEQLDTIVLEDKLNDISLVMTKEYDQLSEAEKKSIEKYDKEAFDNLKKKYEDRLVDYVVQNIYSFSYSNDSYWEKIDDLEDVEKKILEAKYVDNLYVSYQVDIPSLIHKDFGNKNSTVVLDREDYLTIANELSYLYYPSFAKELYAEGKITEEVLKGNEDNKDSENDMIGYFTNSDYVTKFKNEYGNQYDLNLVMIRFKTTDEFNDTLRAFGLKLYNKKYYFVPSETETQGYKEYCDYYDDLANSSLNVNNEVGDKHLLEIFIQIYNYLYGGYRTKLVSGIENLPEINELNDLRKVTATILEQPANTVYDNAVNALKSYSAEETTFTRKELDDIATIYATYLYESLDLKKTCYSTSTQNYNGYYIAYKFGQDEDVKYNSLFKDVNPEDIPVYKELTNDDIVEFITKEGNENLKNELQTLLIRDKVTTSTLSSYLSDAKKEIKVKIFDEATEITYSRTNSDYSKTVSKNKNKNVLATLEYNKKVWNLNIFEDNEDENSICIPGSNKKFGVYNELEKQYGQTTALDVLSKKIIKDTDEYQKTNEDRDTFISYIEAILFNFANEGYSSSGYPSSIGKYNFLMSYFHSADIDVIVDDFYRVQYASAKLLTNYASDSLISFFKEYADRSYDNYFSLGGSRLVVSFDGDDDNKEDEIAEWRDKEVLFEGHTVKLSYVAKSLVYDMYCEINASTDSHTSKLDSLVEEYNKSARIAYDEVNPVPVENQWAKYRKLGLTVEVKEFSVTNSSVDVDFNLKQRLYDYVTKTDEYQYFINDTTPTIYLEPLTEDSVTDAEKIVETEDGYNLILVTTGSAKPSAKLKADDYDADLLNNIVLKYNEKYYAISSVNNENEKLSSEQIKLYLLEYVSTQTSSLTPSPISSSISTFLTPVITRFTSDETQREIVLQYIKNAKDAGNINYTTEGYNDSFNKIVEINKVTADDYIDWRNDPTNTANSFSNWWTELANYLGTKEAE